MDIWTLKLAAFLHDPPEKCLDIQNHETWAANHWKAAGLPTEQDSPEAKKLKYIYKEADHFASSAERFVFPKGKCASKFTGKEGETAIHPLSETPYNDLPLFKNDLSLSLNAILAHERLDAAIGGIPTDDRQREFFLYWRRWLENATATDMEGAKSLPLFPADTRLPDHSIWNHLSATSAVAGCYENGGLKPAMLLFQLGPVQDFIAQARKTRDLWSGSYLLSWLMAHAMKAISDEIGPDAFIFPNLRGNGIFDALHRTTFYSVKYQNGDNSKDTLWERMRQERGDANFNRWLLTPTLPNRFLALVPQSRAVELAELAERTIHKELESIGDSVWQWLATEAAKANDSSFTDCKSQWDYQIKAFPQITWAIQHWLSREDCFDELQKLPNANEKDSPWERLKAFIKVAEETLPLEDRDARYYTDESKSRLIDGGYLWSSIYAILDAKLAARRNTRNFTAWQTPVLDRMPTESPVGFIKDSLSGKEEAIGGDAFWAYLCKQHKNWFTASSHRYGAMNLIKRLWCSGESSYLCQELGMKGADFDKGIGFDSVKDIADKNQYNGNYIAIIAMDGDEMGKWVSGSHTRPFLSHVSRPAHDYLQRIHVDESFQRLLTPAYHLQFSEALSNYANWIAAPVVEAFEGQLIYAGGDDVLAMLPADRAIACAQALRALFCGSMPEKAIPGLEDMKQDVSGFISPGKQMGQMLQNYPVILPGNACTVSLGIAFGHQDMPLQSLIHEAHQAEARAKHAYDRNAVAFSIFKRSGEIHHWGCKWDTCALDLMNFLLEHSPHTQQEEADISGRFPYALARLLSQYQLETCGPERKDDLRNVILSELKTVIQQQASHADSATRDTLQKLGEKWLDQCTHLKDFIQPYLSETFINRQQGDND